MIQQFITINFQKRVKMFAFSFIMLVPSIFPIWLCSLTFSRLLCVPKNLSFFQSWETFQLLLSHLVISSACWASSLEVKTEGRRPTPTSTVMAELSVVLVRSGFALRVTRAWIFPPQHELWCVCTILPLWRAGHWGLRSCRLSQVLSWWSDSDGSPLAWKPSRLSPGCCIIASWHVAGPLHIVLHHCVNSRSTNSWGVVFRSQVPVLALGQATGLVPSLGREMSVPGGIGLGRDCLAVAPQSFCLSICSCALSRSRHRCLQLWPEQHSTFLG